MASFHITSRMEGSVPKLIRVPLIEGGRGSGWADMNMSARSEAAYERAWFEDFRARWQRDLRRARVFTYQAVEVTAWNAEARHARFGPGPPTNPRRVKNYGAFRLGAAAKRFRVNRSHEQALREDAARKESNG